jgi:DNA helicase-2/ATP-dependent DNA helicase PcrA
MDSLIKKQQKHLQTTVEPIRHKLKQTQQELKEIESELKRLNEALAKEVDRNERGEIIGQIKGLIKSQNAYYKRDTLIPRLKSQVNNPYFAKILFKATDDNDFHSYHIGRFVHFAKKEQYRIIDWRSPIASLYYNYNEPTYNAEYEVSLQDREPFTVKGQISERVNFDIEMGKVLAIYDNSLRVDLLKLRIKEKAGGRLTDIVETIQITQNKIIRAKPNRVCIVQGTAGSGKTTIAIHRLSYMLYTYKDTIKENNTMLFSSSKVLINYVASTLPELDVMSIDTNTLEDYLIDILKYNEFELPKSFTIEPKNNQSNFLNNWDFINFIDKYANKRKTEILSDIQDQFFYEDLKLKTYFTRNVNNPLFETLQTINSNLKYRHYSLNEELNKGNFTVEDKVYDHEDALDYLKHLFKDFSLLNEYRNLLTEYSLETKNDVTLPKNKITVDHLSGLFLLGSLLYGMNLKNKLYKQIIVDEAQDMGVLNYFVIKHLGIGDGYTILGDLNQATGGLGTIKSWDELNKIFGKHSIDFFEIKVSYRTTKQLIEYAKNVLKKFSEIKHLPQAFEREGSDPVVKNFSNKKDLINEVSKIIKTKRKTGDIRAVGIIEPDEDGFENTLTQLKKNGVKAKWVKENFEDFSESGTYLIKEKLVKGLEFDTVFVIDPNQNLIPYNVTGAKRMFVCLTRAINNLYVFTVEKNRLLEKP